MSDFGGVVNGSVTIKDVNTSKINSRAFQKIKMLADSIDHESALPWVASHKGYRDGCVHLYLGERGKGKSTMTRTLVNDACLHDEEVDLWLSEETVDEFVTELSYSHGAEIIMPKLRIYSEKTMAIQLYSQGVPFRDHEKIISQKFGEVINSSKFFFFDNITTSIVYDGKHPNIQAEIGRRFSVIAAKNRIPLVLFAHTGELKKGLMSSDDIRGSRDVANKAQFLYLVQQFDIGERKFSTLRIDKSRTKTPSHSMFQLWYDVNSKMYTAQSKAIEFKEFKDAYKARNTL